MPEAAIVLDPGQAEDLRELPDHAETPAQWLLHAGNEIPGDLARTAYPAHFQPRSAVFWLIENLVHTRYRLHKTLSAGGLDTPAPIGNQIPPPLPGGLHVSPVFMFTFGSDIFWRQGCMSLSGPD